MDSPYHLAISELLDFLEGAADLLAGAFFAGLAVTFLVPAAMTALLWLLATSKAPALVATALPRKAVLRAMASCAGKETGAVGDW